MTTGVDAEAVPDRTVAVLVAFLVRVGLAAAALAAFAALVAPVSPDPVACGPAAGYLLGIEGASAPASMDRGEARSKCLRHSAVQATGAVVLAGGAVVVGRALLRRVDPPAGM